MADPRHALLFDAFASPTLESGSDAVLMDFIPPSGMPGGGAGSQLGKPDMPFCATLSVPMSQRNTAGATHRPAIPCCAPLEMGCVSASWGLGMSHPRPLKPWPAVPGKGDKLGLLPRFLQIQGSISETNGFLLLMKLSFIQYGYDFLPPKGFNFNKITLKNSLSYCVSSITRQTFLASLQGVRWMVRIL